MVYSWLMDAPTAPLSDPRSLPPNLPLMIVKIAWLSILLGVGMELFLLLADAVLGKSRELEAILADTLGKVSWAVLACTGLALGARAAQLRPVTTGLAGFLCAPLAFGIARVVHSSVASILETTGPAGALPLVGAVALIKAVEYGTFGVIIGWISTRFQHGVALYALSGTGLGAAFGVALGLAMLALATPTPPLSALVVVTLNESIFALGCALALYVSGVLEPLLQGAAE